MPVKSNQINTIAALITTDPTIIKHSTMLEDEYQADEIPLNPSLPKNDPRQVYANVNYEFSLHVSGNYSHATMDEPGDEPVADISDLKVKIEDAYDHNGNDIEITPEIYAAAERYFHTHLKEEIISNEINYLSNGQNIDAGDYANY